MCVALCRLTFPDCRNVASTENKMLGRKPGSISIRSSKLVTKFSRFGVLSGFSSWVICTLCTNKCCRLWSTLYMFVPATYSSLYFWHVFTGSSLERSANFFNFLFENSPTHTGRLFWTHSPSLKTCQTRLCWFSCQAHSSIPSLIVSLRRNERLSFSVPHKNQCSLLRCYVFLLVTLGHTYGLTITKVI
jgi:hypothetical protein